MEARRWLCFNAEVLWDAAGASMCPLFSKVSPGVMCLETINGFITWIEKFWEKEGKVVRVVLRTFLQRYRGFLWYYEVKVLVLLKLYVSNIQSALVNVNDLLSLLKKP